ncbi:HNH endonuclease signature motif containing protein [Nocardioides coralli]|uniref:HNH endonuclease signature motif containing protein n=1 Tax=Nocardioides coralli TaxID=2872154 RepID=UPI001CA4475D|nr:HNH endonuclease signature motif containing protein [Nocardioides coralli]QZY29745.1 HNH endonuclease [Nocardioides coralli]
MSQSTVPFPHPYLGCVAAVAAAVDGVVGANPVFLSSAAKAEVLLGLSEQVARLEGLRLAVLAAAGDVAEEHGARTAGAWLAHQARLERPEGRRLQRLAEALDQRWSVVAAALLAGEVSRAQAEAIVAALEALPGDLDPELLGRAETRLVGLAAEFGPAQLRRLGQRILDVVAPAVAEEHERRALERAERRARVRMRVRRQDLGEGLVRITADLPVLHADLLYTQLHAHASPRRDHLEQLAHVDRRDPESGERVPYATLLAQGFCSLLERLPQQAAPRHGGDAASLVVTIDHDRLAEQVGVARLGTGHAISVGEARRLACSAGILPMVLDGASQPLDVGRTKRLHTPAMRKALAVRDRECRAEGCDIPAAWTEAHHQAPWSHGGPTTVNDAVLLCSWHHHRAHDRRYDTRRLPNGDLRFHRRT